MSSVIPISSMFNLFTLSILFLIFMYYLNTVRMLLYNMIEPPMVLSEMKLYLLFDGISNGGIKRTSKLEEPCSRID